jgi:hypothetical protein
VKSLKWFLYIYNIRQKSIANCYENKLNKIFSLNFVRYGCLNLTNKNHLYNEIFPVAKKLYKLKKYTDWTKYRQELVKYFSKKEMRKIESPFW